MPTEFATAKDATRIAYDVTGRGPALVLIHGGGQSRRVWHELNYVGRLQDDVTVITIDIRGHGESDTPANAEAYAIDRLVDDVLAVADAARIERFALWGFSFGGNIARYIPMRSNRVTRLAIVGIPFGPAAPPTFRELILGLRAKWTPIIDADRAGTLDVAALSPEDRVAWQGGSRMGAVPVALAWLSAMLEWPPVEPADVSCPALWVVGTANENAMPSATAYASALDRTNVRLQLVPGLTHERELTAVDEMLPIVRGFSMSAGCS